MHCLYCGNKLPEGTIFCNACGKRQNTAATPSAQPAPKVSAQMAPKRNLDRRALAFIVVAAIALVVVIGVIVLPNVFSSIGV